MLRLQIVSVRTEEQQQQQRWLTTAQRARRLKRDNFTCKCYSEFRCAPDSTHTHAQRTHCLRTAGDARSKSFARKVSHECFSLWRSSLPLSYSHFFPFSISFFYVYSYNSTRGSVCICPISTRRHTTALRKAYSRSPVVRCDVLIRSASTMAERRREESDAKKNV